ncbi:MAG TPA: 2-dehydropantoate 2-reductase [Hydrogenophaga sp.]|uniref:2-dehydropantoate 2-reductase n=1 Tax=Hydrogenophaga sp. TaxID=1904254 RepID=UPI002C99FEBD|nr:2-dehydropantoate 2-reductase [Hydrogenophaga sp.]HMN93042.1 2-dehydropantoate 2-reductase [Hydrogenophaga sp.]HMP09827.1 2-dehydropantoate 2-reductase [Hydrogenophaga sp.]
MRAEAAPGQPPRVLVMGAGSVGCHTGGRLQLAGAQVDFVGRPHRLATLRQHGLGLSDLDGGRQHLAPDQLRLHAQVPREHRPDLVLLCVKSGGTETAARELDAALPAGTLVLSLQNGLTNAERAQAQAPKLVLVPGMVPYNVAELGPGHFHRGTDGQLAARSHPQLQGLAELFKRASLPLTLHEDLRPVQLGKLLLNLNNPVNALSGRPLRDQLLQAQHRQRFADLVQEALTLMRQDGAEPARLTPLSWDALLRVLRLPTPLFRLVARRMLRIDPKARSSMADDLAAGRPTEIDVLCGEVVRLAQRLGRSAPMNQAMVEQIHQAERAAVR